MSTIDFDVKDALFLSDMMMSCVPFRDDEQLGRFQLVKDSSETNADLLVHSTIFDKGSFLWFKNKSDALMASKILSANDYESHLMFDERNEDLDYAVLTSYDCMGADNDPDKDAVKAYDFLMIVENGDHANVSKLFETALVKQFKDVAMSASVSDDAVMLRGTVLTSFNTASKVQERLSHEFKSSVGIAQG